MKDYAVSSKMGHFATASMLALAVGNITTQAHAQTSDLPQLEEIVVTAERRVENLQRIAVAAAVLSQNDLEMRHIDNLQQLQLMTPSLSVGEAGVAENVNIRGIGLGVTSQAVPMGVALYRDGLFQGQLLSNEPLFDLASVEVLRGPQGTFVGSNSTGGAIIYRSRNPEFDDVGGYIKGWLGNFDERGAQGAINLPVSRTLAARFAFNVMNRDSFFKQTGAVGTAGLYRHPGNDSQNNLRLSVEWRPLENLTILSKTAWNIQKTDGLAHVMSLANPYYDGRPLSYDLTYNVANTLFNQEGFRQSLQSDYTFAGGITLRAILGYTKVRAPFTDDFDSSSSPGRVGLAPAIGVFNNIGTEKTITQEVNLISPSGKRLEWTLGVFHFWDRSMASLDIVSPNRPTGIISRSPTYKETIAGFGQLNYRLLDDVQIQAGVRYTDNRSRNTGSRTLLGLGPNPLVQSLYAKEADHAWTGKVGLNWTINPNQYAFIFAAKGYKAGGINGPTSPDFRPEEVYDYEIGLKSTWLDSHVRTQINGFYMDYRDLQLTTYIPPSGGLGGANGVANAGQSKIWGFEAQLQARLGGFDLDLGVSNVNSKLGTTLYIDNTKLPGSGNAPLGAQCAPGVASNPPTCFNYLPFTQNLKGGPNPYSPKWTMNVGLQYTYKLGGDAKLIPRIDYSYTTVQYQTILLNPANRIAPHDVVNATLTYANGPWQVEFYGLNLANKVYVAGYTYGPSYFLNRPRQYGVRVSRNF